MKGKTGSKHMRGQVTDKDAEQGEGTDKNRAQTPTKIERTYLQEHSGDAQGPTSNLNKTKADTAT
jgi:hypothetical protein